MSPRIVAIVAAGALVAAQSAFADPEGRLQREPTAPTFVSQGGPEQAHGRKLWGKGQHLPSELRSADLANWRKYGLEPAPEGYRWVHVDDDAYLVEEEDGLIAGAFIGVLTD